MTDRELLELAAKAAGYEFCYVDDLEPHIKSKNGGTEYWNPLSDDGDALRLAAKCKIDIHHGDQYIETLFGRNRASIAVVAEYFRREEHRLESARRAIVRAAAEIAKGKTNG